jgi:hypothetical protein
VDGYDGVAGWKSSIATLFIIIKWSMARDKALDGLSILGPTFWSRWTRQGGYWIHMKEHIIYENKMKERHGELRWFGLWPTSTSQSLFLWLHLSLLHLILYKISIYKKRVWILQISYISILITINWIYHSITLIPWVLITLISWILITLVSIKSMDNINKWASNEHQVSEWGT